MVNHHIVKIIIGFEVKMKNAVACIHSLTTNVAQVILNVVEIVSALTPNSINVAMTIINPTIVKMTKIVMLQDVVQKTVIFVKIKNINIVKNSIVQKIMNDVPMGVALH